VNETAGRPSTYVEMYLRTVRRVPDRDALVFPGVRLTYRELLARGEQRRRELHQLGVGPGDRFGLLMPNCPEIVELVLGAALLGATAVPINTRFKALEIAHVIADAELTSVVTSGFTAAHGDFGQVLSASIPGLDTSDTPPALSVPEYPYLRSVATCGQERASGIVSLPYLERAHGFAADSPRPRAEAPLLIMYTSGTTASPKGCVLNSGGVTRNALAIVDRLAIPDGDVWWDPLPMFHMGGIMLMSAVFAAGGTFISQAHFEPAEAIQLINAEQPTVLYPLFPTITLDVIHHPAFASAEIDAVRLVGSVAPPDVQRRIQDALPSSRLFSAYGITELCGCVAFHSPDDSLDARLTTCGRALDGFEMRVVDPKHNEPKRPGERGELVGRGPQMFTGYYRNPDATSEVIDDDGFFHTGDLCSMSATGEISYHGRIKDMLKVGGENVSAIEIESFLSTHPAIKIAQVVGIPDPRLLEVVAAFIELAPGHALSADEVVEYCSGQIARFKVPRYVRFVDDWPMSATKVQKFRLRAQLLEDLDRDPAVHGLVSSDPPARGG
jgi:fatty-acyl-CoA synthase